MENKKESGSIEFIKELLSYFNLDAELDDYDKVHESICKDIVFRGTNLWILMFAIIVASVGLNMNSTAVIIGAMLISPLMGPINGMGYSIAIYDFTLFRQALKNFSFAVVISLLTSAVYFFLSPISTAHSELLARTSPTIYDVLIALFGGMSGVVAIGSRQKGNVIPGVAIATALMPPLCTAGYGLATGQADFFFGAIYLFTINTVFIALSSVAISQILKFPIRQNLEDGKRKMINRWISAVIILVAFPSIYFGYNLVKKEKFTEQAHKYVKNVSVFEGNYLLESAIISDKKSISLVYGGVTMNSTQIGLIKQKASDFSLDSSKIEVQQGLALDSYKSTSAEIEIMRKELSRMTLLLQEKEQQIDSLSLQRTIGRTILDEIKALYPQMSTCIYTNTLSFSDRVAKPSTIDLIVFKYKGEEPTQTDKEKIREWLQTKLGAENVKVIYEPHN